MSRDERPLTCVPAGIAAAFALLLAAQVATSLGREPPAARALDLPPPPRATVLRIAAAGETAAVARLGMLHLQSFDASSGNRTAYRELDYDRLLRWLRALLAVDPRSEYPLFAAARVYADNPDPAKRRAVLAFLEETFLEDPGRRWPWLAHAALVAKHGLKDLPLARRYAALLRERTAGTDVPGWVSQMEVFVLEDMNEPAAAKALLGALLASGRVRDPAERRFLVQRLEEMEGAGRTEKRQKR